MCKGAAVVQRRAGDEGMTLIEVVVAMAIVTVGLLGMLTEVVSYVRDQSAQRAHATALRVATTTLEDARGQSSDTLASASPQPLTLGGVTYTPSTQVQHCLATVQNSCVTPAAGQPSVARVVVNVTWRDVHGAHNISLNSATTNLTQSVVPGDTSHVLGNPTGASGISVTAGTLSLSPSSTSVDASGTPVNDVTVSLSVVGLASSTSIPLTWTDDGGAHQTAMSNTGGTTWSVTVQKGSINRKVTTGSKSVVFAATVPGVATPVTSALTVVPLPSFNGNCTVTVSPIVTLLHKTTVPEVLSCNTTGLAASDTVRATYASGAGSASVGLGSLDGTTWTATLLSGTSMASSGSSESFTFTLTRASDSYTKSQSLSVPLA
jgi:prepilin-type N-terminal cleavage/methylation domain-containing protein